MPGSDDPEEEAPGWDAIAAAGARAHPGLAPVHFATSLGVDLGDSLQGIDAYREGSLWHLVTYGLSELWAKESDDPEWSGWGYEFTMLVPATEDAPPAWALQLLVKVAEVTQSTGTVFGQGHRLNAGGPVTGETKTRLQALAMTLDPLLGAIDTPNGLVEFLLLVGITLDELETMKRSSTAAVLQRLQREMGALITDPRRS